MMTDYDDFLALKRAGFKPVSGRNRCELCAFHTKTQGHRAGCPNEKRS